MILFLAIPAMIAIGWVVPRWVVRRLGSRWAVLWGSLAALGLGAGLIFAAAHLGAAAGLVEDAQAETEAALNAWKIMLLLAPAAALDARRRDTATSKNDGTE